MSLRMGESRRFRTPPSSTADSDPVRFRPRPCPHRRPSQGRIPTPFIEGWYNVAHIPWTTEGKLILSNGDQTGYSIHVSKRSSAGLQKDCSRLIPFLCAQGDFINGFSEGTSENPSIMRQAMTTCVGMNGGESCVNKSLSIVKCETDTWKRPTDPKACPLLKLQENGKCTAPRRVDEVRPHHLLSVVSPNQTILIHSLAIPSGQDIGLSAPISKIPGNNADWSAPATKPSDPGYTESAQIIDNSEPRTVC